MNLHELLETLATQRLTLTSARMSGEGQFVGEFTCAVQTGTNVPQTTDKVVTPDDEQGDALDAFVTLKKNKGAISNVPSK